MSLSDLAISFEPDGYLLDGPKLMGRQSAGNAFLRAAVAASRERALLAYTPSQRSAEVFARLVASMDPAVRTSWLPPSRLDMLAKAGTLYLPGPNVAEAAWLRLRVAPAAYSISGITHTVASHRAMDSITGLLTGPVMPWDALICTSPAVAKTTKLLLAAEADYLAWRFGAKDVTFPQLPVIPLGVHCDDFAFTEEERAKARRELGIGSDQIVALFVGRLSFHAKAHPYPMYVGLNEAARRTGRSIALVQCGKFSNERVGETFKDGARRFCPDCTILWADGTKPDERARAWACADLFISLSDNVQETFGLTPIEAMAAGLPAVVTDWDGYKETVRDGLDGFRIPTWMPPAALGESMSLKYEAGVHSYDQHCYVTSRLTSLDMAVLVDRLCELVTQPHLRRRLGESGRERARAVFDWSVIFRQYEALWSELAERRAKADRQREAQAPKEAPGRMNPFRAYGHYPTHQLGADTLVARSDASAPWGELIRHPFFASFERELPPQDVFEGVLAALDRRELTLAQLTKEVAKAPAAVATAVSLFAKMGLVRLHR